MSTNKTLGDAGLGELIDILKNELAGIPTGGNASLVGVYVSNSMYGNVIRQIPISRPDKPYSGYILKQTTIYNYDNVVSTGFYMVFQQQTGSSTNIFGYGNTSGFYISGSWSNDPIQFRFTTQQDYQSIVEVYEVEVFYYEYQTCLLEGTKILTMSGEKNIEDLEPGEMIGFWNSESGRNKLEYAKMILPPQEVEAQEYSIYKFSDGAELKMHGIHMLWDADKEHLVRNIDTKIGDRFYNTYGEKVSLVSVEKVNLDEPLKSYNIFVRHRRYLANGIMCGHTNGALYEEYIKPENEQYRYKDPSGEYMAFLKKEYEKTQMYKNPQLFSVIAEATAEEKKAIQEAEAEDAQARKNLADTDYIVAKYAEGLISEEEFAEWKAKREAWRQIVRKNESEIPFLKNELSEKEKQIIKKI